jgi:hypothetical protein
MVEQKHEAKTSSSQRAEYSFPCSILPVSIVGMTESVVDDLGGYVITYVQPMNATEPSFKVVKASRWPEPPHVAFANLHADDPRAAEAFIKRYGMLRTKDPGGQSIDSGTFTTLQKRLRHVWTSECLDIEPWAGVEINGVVEDAWAEIVRAADKGFDTDVFVSGGFVRLQPKDLWATICFLYLRDAQAGKLGVCGNPDCPARYFRKKRKTQKFCEAGPCTDYARRKYALRYWNTEGKKKRDKQAKLQHEKRSK